MTETERREANPRCKARQFSDEMVCVACRLRWDVNDPEPPPCNPIREDPMQPAEHVIPFPQRHRRTWPRK